MMWNLFCEIDIGEILLVYGFLYVEMVYFDISFVK